MARIILVMHAPLGAAFALCAEHVFQKKPCLTVFDVGPHDSPEERIAQLAGLLAEAGENGSLLLCDLFGATPFNIAQQARDKALALGCNVQLVAGANLGMVLKALTDSSKTPETLLQEVRLRALRGIVSADDAC